MQSLLLEPSLRLVNLLHLPLNVVPAGQPAICISYLEQKHKTIQRSCGWDTDVRRVCVLIETMTQAAKKLSGAGLN